LFSPSPPGGAAVFPFPFLKNQTRPLKKIQFY